MSGGDRRFFAGATLAQAVMAAARHYQVPPDELDFRPREKRHGFTHKPRAVVIEVDPAAPRRPAAERAAAPAAPARTPIPALRSRPSAPRQVAAARSEERATAAPVGEEHLAMGAEAARALLAVAGLDLEARASLADGRLCLDLDGADADWLAARGIEPLLAVEHLVRRVLRAPDGGLPACEVDCRGVRHARHDELRSLAAAAAAAVRKTGKPVVLDPLPAAERRVIHLALADASDLVTESLGDGADRRLEIRPSR